MNLEMKPAKQGDCGFAWALFSEFAQQNMFSGAQGRRAPKDWQEDQEFQRFAKYWAAGEHYLITVDEAPIGWAALDKNGKTVVIENWHLLPRWRNRAVTKTILSELVHRWKTDGLLVKAAVLENSQLSSVAEGLLTKLGFSIERLESHSKIMHVV